MSDAIVQSVEQSKIRTNHDRVAKAAVDKIVEPSTNTPARDRIVQSMRTLPLIVLLTMRNKNFSVAVKNPLVDARVPDHEVVLQPHSNRPGGRIIVGPQAPVQRIFQSVAHLVGRAIGEYAQNQQQKRAANQKDVQPAQQKQQTKQQQQTKQRGVTLAR